MGVHPAVLETYGVTACNNLPASGKETFANNSLTDGNGKAQAVSYDFGSTPPSGYPACGYSGNVSGNDYTLIFSKSVGGTTSTGGAAGTGGNVATGGNRATGGNPATGERSSTEALQPRAAVEPRAAKRPPVAPRRQAAARAPAAVRTRVEHPQPEEARRAPGEAQPEEASSPEVQRALFPRRWCHGAGGSIGRRRR